MKALIHLPLLLMLLACNTDDDPSDGGLDVDQLAEDGAVDPTEDGAVGPIDGVDQGPAPGGAGGDPDQGIAPRPDRGVEPDPDQGVEPRPDRGVEPDPDQGVEPRPDQGPPPEEICPIPDEARPVDTSSPDTVIGDGTPQSCTGDAFIEAVAGGGVITFDCGPDPVTITLDRPAKVFNDANPVVVIDGGDKVTLDGDNRTRILYMNTCDQNQHWTTPHCNDQDHPQLTIQNITMINADSRGEEEYSGGGAVWVRGGRLKVINSRFMNNVCADVGPDVGGAAIRAFDQHEDRPIYVVGSTFGGGEGLGNVCSNGGGISSIGVSWTIINSVFSHNRAIGNGANPARPGTPGGGSGGAIYNDGNEMTLSLCGVRIQYNEVNDHGSAIFFVSNNHTGNIRIDHSTITDNIGGSWYPTYPQISNHSDTPIAVTNSTIE